MRAAVMPVRKDQNYCSRGAGGTGIWLGSRVEGLLRRLLLASPGLLDGGFAQYHLPRAKPPKAISPIKTMISPIQRLHTDVRTIPDDHDDAAERDACDSTPIIRSSHAFPPPRQLLAAPLLYPLAQGAQPWGPASTSHRLPAPGSCARVLPETPRLCPTDAERPGRPRGDPAHGQLVAEDPCAEEAQPSL